MSTSPQSAAAPSARRESMGLGAKIGAGFMVVLVLHVAVAVMAHLGQERANDDLQRLAEGRALTGRMLEADRLVGELQRHVQGYTFSGNRGLELRSEQTYEELLERLAQLETARDANTERGVAATPNRGSVAAMAASLRRYHDQFRAAVEDRRRRERLVDGDLAELATRGRDLFDVAIGMADSHGASYGAALREARNHFLQAQNGAHQYLAHLDSVAMRDAHDSLDLAQRLLPDPRDAEDPVAAMAGVFESLHRVFLGLVQSTRGYLHLVNVVMAAEAVDFLRESANLREVEQRRLDDLQAQIDASQARYQWWSNAVSLATIVLGLLAGMVVARLVVRPLQAITETLRRLAGGEQAEIPGLDRRDEIGEMAKAAEVLRERNAEAIKLLSETERLSRQREQVIHDLERSNAELDSFTHIASHDLKAPLRAMANVVRWIEQDCGDVLPEAGRQHLDLLQRRITRMNRLLGDLQNYSRSSRHHEAVASFSVPTAVQDAIEMLDVDGFQLRITGEAAWLATARVPFVQVLHNLIGNAVRHHDRKSGVVTVDVRRSGSGVRVAVTDDGPGIPEAYHQTVFEPFRTLKSRDEHESSGVGLALVKKLVQRYRGQIEVRSPVADSRGTSMILTWPDGDPEEETPKVEAPSTAISLAPVTLH